MSNRTQLLWIQQYLEGKLSPGEMHEFEKQTLDDPFLADALEGYRDSGGVQGHQLSILQRQLETRILQQRENRNNFFFSWQRLSVAAVWGLLFISAGILFWMKSSIPAQTKGTAPEVIVGKNAPVANPAPAASGISAPGNSPAPLLAKTPGKPPAGRATKMAIAGNSLPAPKLGMVAVTDSATTAFNKITTVKESAKADFEDFVGTYPQTAKPSRVLKDTSANRPVSAMAAVTLIAPAGDLSAYKQYLQHGLKGLADSMNFKGVVKIGFLVRPGGDVGGLKITGSPGKRMDRAILKLTAALPLGNPAGSTRREELLLEF